MRHLIPTLLILAASTALVAADDKGEKEPDWNFKSKKATSALKSYSTAVAAENKKAEKANKKHRLKLVMDLETARKKAFKDENLEQANEIDAAIKALKGGAEPAGGSAKTTGTIPPWKTQRKKLIGKWISTLDNKTTFSFLDDGRVVGSWGDTGKWEKGENRVLIYWPTKTAFGTPRWDSFNFPIDPKGVTSDAWHRPRAQGFRKVK